jgi:hypothetical protein
VPRVARTDQGPGPSAEPACQSPRGFRCYIMHSHVPFTHAQNLGSDSSPQFVVGQLFEQVPQWFSLELRSASHPFDQAPSQLPKPGVQLKAQVPPAQVRCAFGGALQACSQQTPSTQKPEVHICGVDAEHG